jgi:uncharacterized protein (TIGR00251 family)
MSTPTTAPLWQRWQGGTLLLDVRVQPRASRDEIVESAAGERLKIRLTASPVDGEANAHLIRLLARLFKVPKSQVTIVTGHTAREKRIAIEQPRQLPPGFAPRHG